MSQFLNFILFITICLIVFNCAHISQGYIPPNYIVIENSAKKSISNFLEYKLFNQQDLVGVAYIEKTDTQLNEFNWRLKNYLIANLIANKIAVVEGDFINQNKLNYEKILEKNINKVILFDIDLSGVKLEKHEEQKTMMTKNIYYNRIAYTKIFFYVIDPRTRIILFANNIDGTHIDTLTKEAIKKINEHDYTFYENKINIYKDKKKKK
ncbi:MAG TPA: hypothetical protein PLD27_06125 [bacterium]|nr:hypothetical protein [bacterium]HOL46864.1 hypothetical protein [bacterium]HPQ18787.1 hypothetical protein [bacterium]